MLRAYGVSFYKRQRKRGDLDSSLDFWADRISELGKAHNCGGRWRYGDRGWTAQYLHSFDAAVSRSLCSASRCKSMQARQRVLQNVSEAPGAPTGASLDNISNSAAFSSLSTATQAALRRLPDSHQYLAASVTGGATLYGKETSQGLESNNAAMTPARCKNPLLSINWHGGRYLRRFHEISQKGSRSRPLPTPSRENTPPRSQSHWGGTAGASIIHYHALSFQSRM